MEARIGAGTKVRLAADFKTFAEPDAAKNEFDAEKTFKSWARRFPGKFERIAVPLGATGLVQMSYHIKVTVRDNDRFWLSSGNWKTSSSQPVIDPDQRTEATEEDLPGNREWHVMYQTETLAKRFRNHIIQDLKRARMIGRQAVPKSLVGRDLGRGAVRRRSSWRPGGGRPSLNRVLKDLTAITAAPLADARRRGRSIAKPCWN